MEAGPRPAAPEPEPAPTESLQELTARFENARAEIERLRAGSAPAAAMGVAVARLHALQAQFKRRSRRKRGERRSRHPQCAGDGGGAARRHYPRPIPAAELRDPADPDFTVSFSPEEGARAAAFMAEFGFVVFRGVVDEAQCARTRGEIFEYMARATPGFDAADETTWGLLSAKVITPPSTRTHAHTLPLARPPSRAPLRSRPRAGDDGGGTWAGVDARVDAVVSARAARRRTACPRSRAYTCPHSSRTARARPRPSAWPRCWVPSASSCRTIVSARASPPLPRALPVRLGATAEPLRLNALVRGGPLEVHVIIRLDSARKPLACTSSDQKEIKESCFKKHYRMQ